MTKSCRTANGLFLTVMIGLGCVASVGQQPRRDEPISDELYRKVQERSAAIAKELSAMKTPGPAGIYMDGDHHPTVLQWAPNAGYLVTASLHTFSPSWVNFGKVTFSDGVLTLHPELSAKEKSAKVLPSRFTLVRWDDWNFLVPEGEMISFAYAVNSGSESRLWEFFVRPGDREKSRRGLPRVSRELRAIMTRPPLKATILDVEGSDHPNVTLSVGRKQGVVEGMSFYYADRQGRNIQFRVSEVSETASIGEVVLIGGTYDGDIVPRKGWKVTSKMPKGFIEPA